MQRIVVTTLALVLLMAGCTTVNVNPAEQAATGTQAGSTGASASADKTPKKPPFKPWKTVLEDSRAIDGYFKAHLKRDNTLYFEVRPDQLDQDFGLVMHFSRGVGVFNLHDGLPLSDTRLMRFQRVGDKLYLVHRNPRFTATAGSPMRNSLDDNVGHSVVAAFDIASQDSVSKALLIDVTSLIVSDYADIGDQLKYYYGNRPASFDKSLSYVEKAQGFPKNVEIDAALSYKTSGDPVANSAGVSDYRSVPVGVRYSFFALPETPMRPRMADDRVGHFLDAVRDFSKDQAETPYERYVNRWRLEKKDPAAAVSEPVKPIVYYIDRSVPKAYRKYVKEGIEGWNKAYEAAGFKNGIVAMEAPDDSTWSAEDIRYSTVRWTAAHQMGYAIGPSQTDPRTGEILNADILISSTFVKGWADEYQDLVGEDGLMTRYRAFERMRRHLPAHQSDRLCMAEMGRAHQLGVQHALLVGLGRLEADRQLPESYLGDAIRDLVMHEVGHTLGLRHNFKGSSAIPYDKINDKAFTREHGLTLSVMDYASTNIAVDPKQQGDFVNMSVGSYDVWAIRYAYTPVYGTTAEGMLADAGMPLASPEAEVAVLHQIASEAANPFHSYNTDEDTHLGPRAVDPLSSTWDLTSDPLRFAADRAALVDRAMPNIERRLVGPGDGYQRLRIAVNGLTFERGISLLPVTKTVGGLYFARDHKGDPNGRLPFTPVPAARQREAVQLIVDQAFAEDAFAFSPDMLNKMAPNRYSDWSSNTWAAAIDYPAHATVGMLQQWLLEELLDGNRLTRMVDNTLRVAPGQAYTVADMFETLTGSIWSEVGQPASPRSVASFRRNLQRMYLDQMVQIMLNLRPSPYVSSVPEDARSLARYELMQLQDRLETALDAGASLDVTTRAHLLESSARIDKAFEASFSQEVR